MAIGDAGKLRARAAPTIRQSAGFANRRRTGGRGHRRNANAAPGLDARMTNALPALAQRTER
jgi:hypothetical protein